MTREVDSTILDSTVLDSTVLNVAAACHAADSPPTSAIPPTQTADAIPFVAITDPTPPFSMRRKVRTLFGASLGLFILINAVLSFTSPFKFDPYKYNYRGWSWWTMDALRNQTAECNVALLGSSLIVSAIAGCDANYLNAPIDMTEHHGMSYLDDRLHSSFGGTFHTFSLAAPGQMPSDAYLTLKAMLATARRPDVVIYGVAPRDFIDSTLNGSNDTDAFHYLTRIINIDEVANAEFRSLWSKLDWSMQHLLYMYAYSLDLRLKIGELADRALNRIAPASSHAKPFTWWDRVAVLPQYLPGEVHPQAIVSSPLKPSGITFVDNTKDYKMRYRNPDDHTWKTQMYFLRKLAEYCHRERVELVLVNMPIMPRNVALLPPGIYDKYLARLREFAWNHDVIFYEMSDFDKYSEKDFHDTVHMNAFGATKFFDRLVGNLKGDVRAATALRLSGYELDEKSKLAAQRTKPATASGPY
jgi:hypothetical protein